MHFYLSFEGQLLTFRGFFESLRLFPAFPLPRLEESGKVSLGEDLAFLPWVPADAAGSVSRGGGRRGGDDFAVAARPLAQVTTPNASNASAVRQFTIV